MSDLTEIIKVWPTCEECVYWGREWTNPQQPQDSQKPCWKARHAERFVYTGPIAIGCGEGLFLVEIDEAYKNWWDSLFTPDPPKNCTHAKVSYDDYISIKNPHVW